jgi:hypothetical protein
LLDLPAPQMAPEPVDYRERFARLFADRSISALLAADTSSKSPCSSARRCRFGPSLVTALDRRFGHRASFAIGPPSERAGSSLSISAEATRPATADARAGVPFNLLIAGNTPPNSTVMAATYHHPRQRRRRKLTATHQVQSP